MRNRERKTEKGNFTDEQMREAVNLVLNEKLSVRDVAEFKGLNKSTLHRYVQKQKQNPSDNTIRMTPNYTCRRVMDDTQENILAEYMLTCAKMNYGLTVKDCRRLAYEAMEVNNLPMPKTWKDNKTAGLEWFRGLLKRHPHLSIRQQESCSLSRSTSFNKHNVEVFFEKLENVLMRHKSFADGSRIWNLDETATPTVQKSKKIIAVKGAKQVNKVSSGEKGTTVTTCCFVSAFGNSIPPAMIFPRIFFKAHMTKDAPPGTLGLANKSGWMTSDLFPCVIEHFIKHTNCSKENPCVLIYDNHESHLSVKALDLAKNNGITILTFPPHCSHKMQPLDVSVYGPFKSYYYDAADSWMMNHPGIPITIYDVGGLVKIAHERSMTPANIIAGFKKAGIFPFDRHVFNEDDFAPSRVTDREIAQSTSRNPIHHGTLENVCQLSPGQHVSPSATDDTTSVTRSLQQSESHELLLSQPGSSELCYKVSQKVPNECTNEQPTASQGECSSSNPETGTFVSPAIFRGFPKAPPRKHQNKGRKRGRTRIATDTPEKTELEEEEVRKTVKKLKLDAKPLKLKIRKRNQQKKNVNKKNITSSSSENENSNLQLSDHDSDEDHNWPPLALDNEKKSPDIDDYVLVSFLLSTRTVFYTGKILSKETDMSYNISYIRFNRKKNHFTFPNVPDIALVDVADIKAILPKPLDIKGTTQRQQNYLKFGVDFSSIEMK